LNCSYEGSLNTNEQDQYQTRIINNQLKKSTNAPSPEVLELKSGLKTERSFC